MHCLAVSKSVQNFLKISLLIFYVRLLDDIGPLVVEADDLHVVDNLVWLVHVPVVKAAKDVLTRSIDCSSQQKVGEKQLVAFVVQFIISIRRHGPVPLGGHFFQVVPGESGEILVEVAQRLSSDVVHPHLATDHIEDHPGDKLNPDGEVINTSAALAHPGPHVKPRGEGDGVDDHFAENNTSAFWQANPLSLITIPTTNITKDWRHYSCQLTYQYQS